MASTAPRTCARRGESFKGVRMMVDTRSRSMDFEEDVIRAFELLVDKGLMKEYRPPVPRPLPLLTTRKMRLGIQ
jgi:hypothetical protein